MAVGVAAATLISGCAWRRSHQGIVVLSQGGTSSLLTAPLSNKVSMFGQFPGVGVSERTYFTRTALSLAQHSFTEVGADFDVDIDSTGRRMVFSSTRHNVHPDLYIKTVDGAAVTQLTSDPGSDIQPSVSPDGKHVAFASNRSGTWDIWVIGIDGGPPVQVTRDRSDDVSPSWSPDGRELVFCSLPVTGGQWELWVANAVAGPTKRFVGYGLFPEWAPVGNRILFQRARERGSRRFSIWTLTLIDGEPRYPTEVASSATEAMILPTWSADGTTIAYVATASAPPIGTSTALPGLDEVYDIWLMAADGRGRIRLTDGHTANFAPTFSPEGRVFFTSRRSGYENIWSMSSQSGSAVAAAPEPAGDRADAGKPKRPRGSLVNDDL